MRIGPWTAILLGCAGVAPDAPVCPAGSAPPPSAPRVEAPAPEIDLGWIAGHAHRIVFEHATGGLVTSELERYEMVREGTIYHVGATVGGRSATGRYTARMTNLEVPVQKVDEVLMLVATAKRGEPDRSKIVVESSDTYLAWSITIDDDDLCEPRSGCHPARSVRLTSRPDGRGFYHWYSWGNGVRPIPLDRAIPDEAARALLALVTRV